MTTEKLIKLLEEKRSSILDRVEAAANKSELDSLQSEIDEVDKEIRELENRADYGESERTRAVNNNTPGIVLSNARGQENNEVRTLNETATMELRSLQKFLSTGINSMTDQEQRSLTMSGSAAILPIDVYKKLISNEKYSDILHRATVFSQGGAGKIYIPIASNTAADWKIENSAVDGSAVSYDKSPTLTQLELSGYELMRLMSISAATFSMAAEGFEKMLLELLAAEVIETLEKSFIAGTGVGQPKGLEELTWVSGENAIYTAAAATPIAAKDIAEAMSLLPQKYARNAIVLCNSDMLYQISMFKGTQEYAYSMANGATTFLGKEIVVSEHCEDDTVFIVDPAEIYIRFAQDLMLEADRSAGFTQASIFLRALTVCDAVINPSAAVKVGLGS